MLEVLLAGKENGPVCVGKIGTAINIARSPPNHNDPVYNLSHVPFRGAERRSGESPECLALRRVRGLPASRVLLYSVP
jgi:hypothetical protein